MQTMAVNFFARIKELLGIKEQIIEEKLVFDDIENWVGNQEKKIKTKEKEIFDLIKDRTATVLEELNEKIKVLKIIDVDSIKAEDRIKLIVNENLNNYLGHVRKFVDYLSNLKEEEFEKMVYKINNIFADFNKKSYTSYQKATILIGKEMATTKESTINLSKYFEKLFNENKDLLNLSKSISFIKLNLKQVRENEEGMNRTNKRIQILDGKMRDIEEKNKEHSKEIEKIKRSENYIQNSNEIEKINSLKVDLEKEILRLKEIIDFKALGNFFHINQEDMNEIKTFKENFQKSFEKDNGKKISNLLNESKLNNEQIIKKINQIAEKKQEIIKIEETIKDDLIEPLFLEIKNKKLEVESLKNERVKELKKFERYKINRGDVVNPIKKELSGLNVVVENF